MAHVHQIWIIWILFLKLLHFSYSSITPRTSFLIGSSGRLLSVYNTSDVLNTTTLLLSQDAGTLFVGARDAVLSLDVSQSDGLTLKHKYDWASPETERHRCGSKLASCANFIKILQFINSTHLYACGSFAYNPQDVMLTVDTLSAIREPKKVKGFCPYNGATRSTAVFVDGELYTATTTDYHEKEPKISRHLSKGRNELETLPEFLNDPTFISSFVPSEKKVLFFFRELEAESKFAERLTVARVAQVCTDDNGGKRVLQKRWTTFVKSQLICQTQNQLPFTVLQDVVMVPPAADESPDLTLFYGIFTSQWSLAAGHSAVCVFTLKDIEATFSGNYKSTSASKPKADVKPGKCGLHNASDDVLGYVKKTFLTAQSVQPVDQKQLLTTGVQQYSRITAQKVQDVYGHIYTILYLLSEAGFLHKVVLLKNRPHIIEEIQVFKHPQSSPSILLSATKGVVFVGFSEGVIRVPASNCSFYSSCAECVLAQDPFCGWDSQDKVCVLTSIKPNLHQDVENGNVNEQCKDTENYRTPVRHVVQVHLHKFVVFPCQSSFKQAQVIWRFSNHSIVPQSLYLQSGDGSLVFLITPNTPQEFHCVTEEQGFENIVSIFTLRVQDTSPMVRRKEDMELIPEFCYLDGNTIAHNKSYYTEMVAVSVLLALCLCVLAVAGVLWCNKSHSKAGCECLPFKDISSTDSFNKP